VSWLAFLQHPEFPWLQMLLDLQRRVLRRGHSSLDSVRRYCVAGVPGPPRPLFGKFLFETSDFVSSTESLDFVSVELLVRSVGELVELLVRSVELVELLVRSVELVELLVLSVEFVELLVRSVDELVELLVLSVDELVELLVLSVDELVELLVLSVEFVELLVRSVGLLVRPVELLVRSVDELVELLVRSVECSVGSTSSPDSQDELKELF